MKFSTLICFKVSKTLAAVAVAATLFCASIAPAPARSPSFGGGYFGGSHSFGGGSFGGGSRSFGGGSFGGGSYSHSFGGGSYGGGGSFGGSRSYSASPSSGWSFGGAHSFGGGSFGGGFGGSRAQTSAGGIRTSPGFGGGFAPSYYVNRVPVRTTYDYYGGRTYAFNYYGGWNDYSFAWAHPMWYYYTPFHPAFYFGPPYYVGGMAYPGVFNWGHLLIGLIVFAIIFMILARMVRGRTVTVRNW